MDNKILEELHESVAKELLAKVKSGEATASELSVATKFLKDNGAVNEVITAESPMANLLEALPFEEMSH
ncbi:MAG: hypothetical protein EBY39_05625 [Flavobacteriia bacterium]|nr:hypothetical protein [Flavobacteriia bacterium]